MILVIVVKSFFFMYKNKDNIFKSILLMLKFWVNIRYYWYILEDNILYVRYFYKNYKVL